MTTESDLEERLRAHVYRLAGEIGPRHPYEPEAFAAAVEYVERGMGRHGERVSRETYDAAGTQVSNLIVERRGTKRPGEIILVGAHYDTVVTTPGADDNASAVAAMIEIMDILHEVELPRTVRFVAFACEEPPHFNTNVMGSVVCARGCRARGERIRAMVCLEMLGFYSDAPNSQRRLAELPRAVSWAIPSRANFLASVGNLKSWRTVWTFHRGFRAASDLRLFSLALPESVSAIRLSDNASFWDQGYPAIMVTDTSFLRNPHYHWASDRPETLDYPRLAAATRGAAGGIRRLAGG